MEEDTFDIFNSELKTPFSMIVGGPSQSGKTTFVSELIKNNHGLIEEDFDYILWFYGETIPKISELKLDERVIFIKGIPHEINGFLYPGYNGLAVFDDLMTEVGNNKLISSFFTKKSHHQNLSVIFITQNYFGAGSERINMTKNATYTVIFNDPKDYSIVKEIGPRILPGQQKAFREIFSHAVDRPHGYLFLDGHQYTPKKARIRTDITDWFQRVFIPSS